VDSAALPESLVENELFGHLRGAYTGAEPADVRLVCATHRALEGAPGFRQDLYYRIRVVEIVLPPLRERGHDDLDRLVDHLLFEAARRPGRPGLTLAPAPSSRRTSWSCPSRRAARASSPPAPPIPPR
jgi:transcriptional regulator with GAF, ATPase, and Fis domain